MLPQVGERLFPLEPSQVKQPHRLEAVRLSKRIGLLQQAGNHPGHAVGLLQHGDAGLHQHLLFRHV